MSFTVALQPGTRIAPHLTIGAILGEGGMARVYEAEHTRLNIPVAVKVLSVTGKQAQAAAERLIREAHICAQLEDPRIPRVLDVSTLVDGRPYVVMEKVRGPTLEKYLNDRGQLPAALAVRIAREVLQALRVVHAAGVVHRDVKPDNIILQLDGDSITGVHLMDFGIAHLRRPTKRTPALTIPTTFLGTPGYMAPEQTDPESVDPRADLYSMGIVLYEMLVGDTPFDGMTPLCILRESLERDVPNVRKRVRSCPKALAHLVQHATRRDRKQRIRSASDFARALDQLPAEHPAHGARGWGVPMAAAAVSGALWLAANQTSYVPWMNDTLHFVLGTPIEAAPEQPRANPETQRPEALAQRGTPWPNARVPETRANLRVPEKVERSQADATPSPEPSRDAERAQERHPRKPRTRARNEMRRRAERDRDEGPTDDDPPTPATHGLLVSEYLEELERVVQNAGFEPLLPPPAPIKEENDEGSKVPPNPY